MCEVSLIINLFGINIFLLIRYKSIPMLKMFRLLVSILKQLFIILTKPLRVIIYGKIGEQKVKRKLNRLIFGRVEHKLINNLILVDENLKSHQIDHVEIRHNGIFCIETKNYSGVIFGNEKQNKWTQCLYGGEKNYFLNPVKQNNSHIYYISKVLGSKYKINSLIVFVKNNSNNIDCEKVINLNKLRKYLKNYNDGICLSTEEMNNIYDKLINSNQHISNRTHIKNIRKTQKEINLGICPRCGGSLIIRNGKNGKFYGCSNYPKCKFVKSIYI